MPKTKEKKRRVSDEQKEKFLGLAVELLYQGAYKSKERGLYLESVQGMENKRGGLNAEGVQAVRQGR